MRMALCSLVCMAGILRVPSKSMSLPRSGSSLRREQREQIKEIKRRRKERKQRKRMNEKKVREVWERLVEEREAERIKKTGTAETDGIDSRSSI